MSVWGVNCGTSISSLPVGVGTELSPKLVLAASPRYTALVRSSSTFEAGPLQSLSDDLVFGLARSTPPRSPSAARCSLNTQWFDRASPTGGIAWLLTWT